MKKLLVVLLLTLLIGCTQQQPKDGQVMVDNASPSYKYTIDGKEEALTLTIPTVKLDKGDERKIVYSLNPLQENKNERDIQMALFFDKDAIDPSLKERIYEAAFFGYGFWQLNDVGNKKIAEKQTLQDSDYALNFGDFYNKTDVKNDDKLNYYLATQQIIWESLINPETKKNFVITFKDVDVSKEKELILKNIKDQKRIPFTKGNVINLKEEDITNQKTFSLVDDEKVLFRYELVKHPDVEVLDIKNNTLTFKVKKFTEGLSLKLVTRYKLKEDLSYVFNSNEDISYLSIGHDHYRERQVVHIEKQSLAKSRELTISTYDSMTKELLDGAQYELSDGPEFTNPIQSSISEEKKPASFTDIKPGHYWIQQVKTPEGYIENSQVLELDIEQDTTFRDIPFQNEKQPQK